ncbi:hypothetical protein VARIO8X_160213 [Burkholderiales bacterium 8X]|nr:hypothetical protein VARIO8X_160213 [Burkholderiales bacterium 8X]
MEIGKFTGLSNAALSEDGVSFRVDIGTAAGPVPLEAPVADIGKFMHLLSKVSLASAEVQKLPRHFPADGTLSLRPVEATAMGVMHGEPGKVMVLMRVGATTLAFSMDHALLGQFALDLQAKAATFLDASA